MDNTISKEKLAQELIKLHSHSIQTVKNIEEEQLNILSAYNNENPTTLFWYKSWNTFTEDFIDNSNKSKYMIPFFGRMDLMNDNNEFRIYFGFFKPLRYNHLILRKIFSFLPDTKNWRVLYSSLPQLFILIVLMLVSFVVINPYTTRGLRIRSLLSIAVICLWFILSVIQFIYNYAGATSGICFTELSPEAPNSDEHWDDYTKNKGICLEYDLKDIISSKYPMIPVIYRKKSIYNLKQLWGKSIWCWTLGALVTKEPFAKIDDNSNLGKKKNKDSRKEKEWRSLISTGKGQMYFPVKTRLKITARLLNKIANHEIAGTDPKQFTASDRRFAIPKKIYYKGLSDVEEKKLISHLLAANIPFEKCG